MASTSYVKIFFMYFDIALPYFYNGGQVTANATSTSVTITWNEWNQDIDYGTGPVDHHKAYYWKTDSAIYPSTFQVSSGSSTDIINLFPETMYNFSVAAVKTYQMLEGPRSMDASAITGCGGMSKDKETVSYLNLQNKIDIRTSFLMQKSVTLASCILIRDYTYFQPQPDRHF